MMVLNTDRVSRLFISWFLIGRNAKCMYQEVRRVMSRTRSFFALNPLGAFVGSLATVIMEPIGQMEDLFSSNQSAHKRTTAQTTRHLRADYLHERLGEWRGPITVALRSKRSQHSPHREKIGPDEVAPRPHAAALAAAAGGGAGRFLLIVLRV